MTWATRVETKITPTTPTILILSRLPHRNLLRHRHQNRLPNRNPPQPLLRHLSLPQLRLQRPLLNQPLLRHRLLHQNRLQHLLLHRNPLQHRPRQHLQPTALTTGNNPTPQIFKKGTYTGSFLFCKDFLFLRFLIKLIS